VYTTGVTISEIDAEFRRLCLNYHPDKDGDVDDFYELQRAMQAIKMSKEMAP
jgi:curved DNA-binding protein CbpA